MTTNNTDIYFMRRASVRVFDKNRHIDDSTLRQIVELASHAPNTGNMQLYSVVVTRGQELKTELAALHAYYKEKESLPESAGFISMNGKKTLAQVYADIRYPRDLNESVGQAMLKHMSQV